MSANASYDRNPAYVLYYQQVPSQSATPNSLKGSSSSSGGGIEALKAKAKGRGKVLSASTTGKALVKTDISSSSKEDAAAVGKRVGGNDSSSSTENPWVRCAMDAERSKSDEDLDDPVLAAAELFGKGEAFEKRLMKAFKAESMVLQALTPPG